MPTVSLAVLSLISLLLTLWQWLVARRFPVHQRVADRSFAPAATLLKPLKGVDAETPRCLESWLTQNYSGPVQALFGVPSAEDPACAIVRQLLAAHPECDAELVICEKSLGANAKVSTLVQLYSRAKHDVIIISDADVLVPEYFLSNAVAPLRDTAVGLVNCFYRLADPATLAMQWEAIAINADFWSQVLQSQSLKPLDFALGAAMATRRGQLDAIGRFDALADFLADDYRLGNEIARRGGRIVLLPVVVECRDAPKNWSEVWRHQLRWARTIRVCQPIPWFFSILSNATLWPFLWLMANLPAISSTSSAATPSGTSALEISFVVPLVASLPLMCWAVRILTAMSNQSRLTRSRSHWVFFWLIPIKDLLSAMIWALSFLGNTVEWRGQRYRIRRDGRLMRSGVSPPKT